MKKKQLIIISILCLIGWVVSILLGKIGIDVLMNPEHISFCNFNTSFNCDSVALSEFSAHFGIPNFIYGIIFYAVLFAAAFYKTISKKEVFSNFFIYLFLASAGAVALSVYLFFVSHLAIHSFCVLCMMIYVTNIMLFITALWAEDFSIDTILRKLLGEFKLFFSSFYRTTIFFVVCIIAITILLYFDKHPLLAQLQNMSQDSSSIESELIATPDRLVYGSTAMPDLTVIVFSDYECHFCGKANIEIKKLIEANDNLRIIYKDYPLDISCNPRITRPFHQRACQASFAARCAAEQGKFLEYHEKLYAKSIKDESFKTYANELGLDMTKFSKCLKDQKYNEKIQADIDEAVALGVEGTPTVFIEGVKLVGYRPYEEYQKVVDKIKIERKKMMEEYKKRIQEKEKKKN